MKIYNLEILDSEKYVKISATIESENLQKGPEQLWFKLPKPFDARKINIGDSFLSALLVPCMMIHEDLNIEIPVSPELATNAQAIQNIFYNWHKPLLKKINIYTIQGNYREESVAQQNNAHTASFFSGGVDSWHTFLSNKQKVTSLIIVNGFDILLKNTRDWEIASTHFDSTTSALGISGIHVETNVRDIIDPQVGALSCEFKGDAWGLLLHGGCLAAVGFLMQGRFNEILISSSYSYKQLHPWGSHPLIDEKWSIESLRFIHDGCDANRMDKIKFISGNKDALDHLRVCWAQNPGFLNCCECEKCLRTMLALKVIGKLEGAKAFHLPYDDRILLRSGLKAESAVWYEDILQESHYTKNDYLIKYLESILGKKFSALRIFSKIKRKARDLLG